MPSGNAECIPLAVVLNFECVPENVESIPLAVVFKTTVNGMHSAFSGKHPKYLDKF